MRMVNGNINLDDDAVRGWMALHQLLWRFGIMPQFYNSSGVVFGLSRIQTKVDNET